MVLHAASRFGGAKRLFYLAAGLKNTEEIKIISLDSCREKHILQPGASQDLDQLVLPLDLGDGLRRTWLTTPLDVSDRLESVRKSMLNFVGSWSPDIVLIAYPAALAFRQRSWPWLPKPWVYLEDDFFEDNLHRQVAEKKSLSRLWITFRFLQFKAFYRKAVRQAKTFLVISEEEREIVKGRFPGIRTHLVGYGLPLRDFPMIWKGIGGMSLGFIGNYNHPPNREALHWLVIDFWPRWKKDVPTGRLVLAGAGLQEEWLRTATGIEALGEVESVSDFYRKIDFFVNPIFGSRGLRTKLVEAAAFGVPLLSTPLGAEGLSDLEIGYFQTPEELAKAIVELRPRADAVSSGNRKAVETRHSQAHMVEQARTALIEALNLPV